MDSPSLDDNMVLEAPTEDLINQHEADIYQAWVEAARAAGYTIIDNQVVPKNPDGSDNLTAQRTVRWDIPKVTDKGTFYIESVDNVENIVRGVEGVDFQELPKPEAWPGPDAAGATSDRFDNGMA